MRCNCTRRPPGAANRKAGQPFNQQNQQKGKTEMSERNKNTNGKRPEQAEQKIIQVLTRFTRAELDAMREETGASADATAIACYVRKNIHKRG